MIRKIGMFWLTLALGLVFAPSKEANGQAGTSVLRLLDKLAQNPVIVKVSVLNQATGDFVPNLKAEDFTIEENGEKQKPTRFLHEERPLSILLLLDSSGSMRPFIQPIIEGVSNQLRRLKPDDEVALISFNDSVNLVQDFTRNKGLVEEKLRRVVASRRTLARQALLQAATHILKATAADSRRIIVVLTDNRSSTPGDVLTEKAVMQQLSASGSVVCGVVVSDPPRGYPASAYLDKKATGDITPFVDETGGIVETVTKFTAAELSTRLAKTLNAFRNYYWIEYLSRDAKRDGKHRKIKVTLSGDEKKSGGKLTVLAKRGYYAPNDAKSVDQK